MLLNVGEDAFGEDYALKFCGGNVLSGVARKTESGGGVRSSQFIYDN